MVIRNLCNVGADFSDECIYIYIYIYIYTAVHLHLSVSISLPDISQSIGSSFLFCTKKVHRFTWHITSCPRSWTHYFSQVVYCFENIRQLLSSVHWDHLIRDISLSGKSSNSQLHQISAVVFEINHSFTQIFSFLTSLNFYRKSWTMLSQTKSVTCLIFYQMAVKIVQNWMQHLI